MKMEKFGKTNTSIVTEDFMNLYPFKDMKDCIRRESCNPSARFVINRNNGELYNYIHY